MSDERILTCVGTQMGPDYRLSAVAKQGVQGVQGAEGVEHFVAGETSGGSIFRQTMSPGFA